MADSFIRSLKAFGLTPWQLILGIAIGYGWLTSLAPMPGEFRALNETVGKLSTKVEIHSVLIAQIMDLSKEVKAMRGELSNIEVRLVHADSYKRGAQP